MSQRRLRRYPWVRDACAFLHDSSDISAPLSRRSFESGVTVYRHMLRQKPARFMATSVSSPGGRKNMITTNDPDAITEYRTLFETKWEEAIPVDEAEYGTTSK